MGFAYLKFYTADWLEDTAGLSLKAQALWMRTICRLAKSDTPGASTYSSEVWARCLGIPHVEFPHFVQELKDATVGEVEELENGKWTIRSRRMMRDWIEFEDVSEKRRKAGRASAEARAEANRKQPDNKPATSVQQVLEQTGNTESTLCSTSVSTKPQPNQKPEAISKHTHLGAGAHEAVTEAAEHHNPTLDEVLTAGGMDGVTPESAESFWRHHEGNNLWVNQHGRAINWRVKLKGWGNKDSANGNNRKNHQSGRREVDRNAGTANEGRASAYDGVGRVARD